MHHGSGLARKLINFSLALWYNHSSMKILSVGKKLRTKLVITNNAKSHFWDIKQFLVKPYSNFLQVKSIEKQNKSILSFTLSMIIISSVT